MGYQVFATMATFYVPLVAILLLYWRIFVTARARLRNRLAQKAQVQLHQPAVKTVPSATTQKAAKTVKVVQEDVAVSGDQETAIVDRLPPAINVSIFYLWNLYY